MASERKRDVEVFTEAIQLPGEQRMAFVNRACAGDAALLRRVVALLRSNDRAGEFLETPPTGSIDGVRAKVAVGEKAGDRVDRYKLLQQIGEGGYGVVFVAEQEAPVRRRVALKVVKPGMDTESVIARFEAERQALALMDHPNIAHVFDAGATKSGRPYFVMELVKGVKITEYCDQHLLSIHARLDLFAQVCDAIQHAHQKGIIHRDIKPSNIMVATGPDGKPAPKVIDFGIAKATIGLQLTDKTIFTGQEMLIGTPTYMSPEQAALGSAELDTRTDIYSLGVLLYELLTGMPPFDTGELLKIGLDEMRRVIREQEPARPSTRLTEMAARLVKVAEHRQTNPPTLIRAVRGDLDWIAMKALEKDRTRRYATANGLALDIRRFLADEPILARPPSKVYQIRKAAVRHKLLFTAVGVIALFLVVSLIVVSASLTRERQLRREAVMASDTSQEVAAFVEHMFSGAAPANGRGQNLSLFGSILDQTTDRLNKGEKLQPAVEAQLRAIIGKLYEDIGDLKQAEEMERGALAIRLSLFGSNNLVTATSLNDVGLALMAQHKAFEAEKFHAAALAIRGRLAGEGDPATATSLNDLAAAYRDEGRVKEAEPLAEQALRIRRKVYGTDTNLEVADSLRNLSIIYGGENRWAEAYKTAKEVLVLRTTLLGREHPWVASSLEDVAWAASGVGDYDEAERVEAESMALRQKILGDADRDVGRNLNALGQLLGHRNDLPTSDAVLKVALSIQRKLIGDDQRETLETFRALSSVLNSEGKSAEAESVLRDAQAAWSKRPNDVNPERLYMQRSLGDTLEQEGKWPDAVNVWRDSLTLWRKRGGVEEHESMYTLRRLGLALEAEHNWPDAESVFGEAWGISRKKGDEDSEALADEDRLVRVLTSDRKFTEAQNLLDNTLTPTFVKEPASGDLLVRRVNLLGRQGRWEEAATAAALVLQNQPTDHYGYHTLAALLAMTHDRSAYKEVCQKLLTRFANPNNPYVAERMAQDNLLLPNSGANLDLIDKLADTSLALGSSTDSMPYFRACKAMSQYRLGHFKQAAEWAERSIKSAAEAQAKAKALAILSMANWQLGQKDAARAALAKGDAAAPKFVPGHDADLGGSWVAWMMARITLDEAEALVGPAAARSVSNGSLNRTE